MSTDNNLKSLTATLDGPLMVVTTDQCADARKTLARYGLAELEAMCGIDDAGIADGVDRGLWTVSA